MRCFNYGKIGVSVSILALLTMGGCLSLNSPEVQRIAQQNKVNAEMLNANAKTLMSLVEYQYEAQRTTLLRLQIARTFVGVNTKLKGLNKDKNNWSDYLGTDTRWTQLESLDKNELLSRDRIDNFKLGLGWVMSAYLQEKEGGRFSPAFAYKLTRKTLGIEGNGLLSDGEKTDCELELWRDFDPQLAHFEKTLQDFHEILLVMRNSIDLQTANSDKLSRELFAATQAKTDVMGAIGGIIESEEFGVLFDKLTVKDVKPAGGDLTEKQVEQQNLEQFLFNLGKGIKAVNIQ